MSINSITLSDEEDQGERAPTRLHDARGLALSWFSRTESGNLHGAWRPAAAR
jgi:hypothetical protein